MNRSRSPQASSEEKRSTEEASEIDAKPSGSGWFSFSGASVESNDGEGIPMPVERDAIEYNMDHPRRGKALIFNNKNFEKAKLPSRNGTDVDRDQLEQTLTALGFEVEIHNDASVSKIQTVIHSIAEDDHSDHDCLLVAVFSHGEPNLIYASDYTYKPDILWDPFTADRCTTLAGKPKIFLIQACQGDQLDAGSRMVHRTHKIQAHGITATDSLAVGDKSYRIPNRADFLMVYSTVPGYYSWRNSAKGSWFVQSFNKIFRQYGHAKELLSLMTHVTREVALNFESFHDAVHMDRKKQVPFVTSTLTREVYFKPKPKIAQEYRASTPTPLARKMTMPETPDEDYHDAQDGHESSFLSLSSVSVENTPNKSSSNQATPNTLSPAAPAPNASLSSTRTRHRLI